MAVGCFGGRSCVWKFVEGVVHSSQVEFRCDVDVDNACFEVLIIKGL